MWAKKEEEEEEEDQRIGATACGLNARKRFKAELSVDDEHVVVNPWRMHGVLKEMPRNWEVHFDDLKPALMAAIERLGQGAIVVGCVAWLSDIDIMETMRRHCRTILIVVNNEDYGSWGHTHAGPLTRFYKQLPGPTTSLNRLFAKVPKTIATTLFTDGTIYEPVRSAGAGHGELMHSKYLVFFDPRTDQPAAVWTGSMNMTHNSTCNQENAQLIESSELARYYFNDFLNTFLVSETLRDSSAPFGGSGGDGD